MDKEIVVRLHSSFEEMARREVEHGPEYWLARDLQLLLGYAQWRTFANVIEKAVTAARSPASTLKTILRMRAKWSIWAPVPSVKSRISHSPAMLVT